MMGPKKSPSPSFGAVLGSGIRDPRFGMDKDQDMRSRINILDPKHCVTTGIVQHLVRYRDTEITTERK
jgi:hypothetical protein